MPSRREEIETEIAAFVGSWLDGADEIYQEGWSVGTFGFVFEVEHPPDQDGPSGYSEIGFTCSDPRAWIQAGLFRRAMLSAEREVEQAEEE